MPVLMTPKSSYEAWLKSDEAIEEKDRPTFVFRPMSVAEWSEVANIYDAAMKRKDGDPGAIFNDFIAIVRRGLIDWRNMVNPQTREPEHFSGAKLENLFTPQEVVELAEAVMRNNRLDHEGKGGSGSPSPSSSTGFAKAAPKGAAT